jgi:plastocyanin
MFGHSSLIRAVVLVLALPLLVRPAAGDEGDLSRRSNASTGEAAANIVEGVITYTADAKRAWRYQRYYVNSKSKGELAEAVVCLRGTDPEKDAVEYTPQEVVIDQQDFRFVPETTVIRAGDRIKFTNNDPGTHNVFSHSSLHTFDIALAYGDETVETFDKAGGASRPIVLGCRFHGNMQAWIYVFDHPYYCLTDKDGRFRFENVPPGEYRLEVVHPAGSLRTSRKIEVGGAGSKRVDISLSPDNLFNVAD